MGVYSVNICCVSSLTSSIVSVSGTGETRKVYSNYCGDGNVTGCVSDVDIVML